MKIIQLIKDYLKQIHETLEEDGMHMGCPLCKGKGKVRKPDEKNDLKIVAED